MYGSYQRWLIDMSRIEGARRLAAADRRRATPPAANSYTMARLDNAGRVLEVRIVNAEERTTLLDTRTSRWITQTST